MLRCATHPEVETGDACDVCRRPFCPNCLVESMGGRLCESCRNQRLAALHASGQQEGPPCPRCRAQTPAGAPFCPWCGQPLEQAPQPAIQFTVTNNIFVALLVISVVFSVAYRLIQGQKLVESYATFIGVPLLIGVLTAYLVRTKSGLGATLKITTIILCIVAPMLGEGAVCILMAAPLFYGVAVVGYLLVWSIGNLMGPRGRGGMMAIVCLPFLLARATTGPEGIRNGRTLTVRDSIAVRAPTEQMWATLQRSDLISPDVPAFLRLGFPLPRKLERLSDGTARLTFNPGSEPWPGTNVMVSREVADPAARRLTFLIHEDGTKLSRWLTFHETRFSVEPCAGGSRLTQTTVFTQRLQPGFYWDRVESYAMGRMHGYALAGLKRLAEEPGR